MTTLATGRQMRLGKKGAAQKFGLISAAAFTAVTMTAGVAGAPTASALPSGADIITTGPLLWLAAQLGFESVEVPNPLPVGPENLTINLHQTDSDPVVLYNAINAVPFGLSLAGLNVRPALLTDNNVAPILLAMGTGTTAAIDAYNALMASAAGNTPEGFTPLSAGVPVVAPNVTDLVMVLARSPYTPNGGIFARLPDLAGLLGIHGTSPDGESASSSGIDVHSAVANLALGYDWMSDFPVTGNLFSLANSFLAGNLPTYLLGGVTLAGATEDDIKDNIIDLYVDQEASTSYSTLDPNDLPLLEPLRLPARIINFVLEKLGVEFRVPTILADILEPAARILVNIGYTDVVTPSEGGTYNRTFDQSGTPTPWLSQNPLTVQEMLAVPGDVIKALVDGFTAEMEKLFGGGATEEPAPEEPAAAAAVASNAAQADVLVSADVSGADDTADNDAVGHGAAGIAKLSAAAADAAAAAADDAPTGGTGAGESARESASAAGKSSDSPSAKNSAGPSRSGLGGSKRARAGSVSDAA
jgi:hypothetical protein